MIKSVKINKPINSFNKKIYIEGDKSLSIRWALISSQSEGKSVSYNLLRSEDVIDTLKCLKKLGVKVNLFKNSVKLMELDLMDLNIKKISF